MSKEGKIEPLRELVVTCEGLGVGTVPVALLRDMAERQPVGLERDAMALLKRHGCLRTAADK